MEVRSLLDIPLESVDLLLLDLDNTLYEYKQCHNTALQSLVKEFAIYFQVEETEASQLYHDCRKNVHDQHLGTATEHSRLFYIQGMVERVAKKTIAAVTAHLHQVYWSSYLNAMHLFKESIPFLESCRQKGVLIVLVTDLIAEIQFKKVEKLKISEFLDFIVTSEEAGVEKPHPYIFELAIKKALTKNRNLNKIMVVGDNVKKDTYSSDIYETTVFHLLK